MGENTAEIDAQVNANALVKPLFNSYILQRQSDSRLLLMLPRGKRLFAEDLTIKGIGITIDPMLIQITAITKTSSA